MRHYTDERFNFLNQVTAEKFSRLSFHSHFLTNFLAIFCCVFLCSSNFLVITWKKHFLAFYERGKVEQHRHISKRDNDMVIMARVKKFL